MRSVGRRRVIEALLKAGCLMHGTFKLSSGGVSSVYVDVRRLYSHPQELRIVVGEMAEVVRGLGCELVVGVETGGIPLAALVAYLLEKPMVYVRKKPKEHGTQRMIEGDLRGGGRGVVVDDVATTGSSILRAVRALEEAGVEVRDALVVVDRGEGARRALESVGVKLHALTTLSELLEAEREARLGG
ncbi:MAG: orotate phosphoribosyltransferase [Thermoprotei archaeon]|nr:MAG: orotate phosphoribosyltransferase [Thermoprotei archaeon]RLE94193.1 MAG: orotate phosphoribosyltransferase [Thermoprotei archaeon]